MAVVLQTGNPVTNVEVGGTSQVITVPVAAGTDTVGLAIIQGEGNGSGGVSVSSVVRGGESWTLLDKIARADWSFVEMWYKINPLDATTGSNADMTVTFSESDNAVVGVYIADGVDQTTPFRTAQKTSGSGTSTGTLTVPSVASDDLVVDGLCVDSTGNALAPGADQTERWELDTTAGSNEGASSTQPGSAGGAMSWSWGTSRPWTYIATAFRAAAAGGTAHTKNLNDTITLSDTVVKRVVSAKADTITLSDAVAKTVGITKSDSITLSDAIAKAVALTKADSLAMSDVVAKAIGLASADTISLSDNISVILTPGGGVAYTLSFEDTITLSDAVAKRMGLGRADQINLADDLARALNGKFIGGDEATVARVRTVILGRFGIY